MKKIFFVLVLFGAALGVQAQVNSLGPTAGFNYAWLSEPDNADARPSFNVGLTYNYSIFESAGIGIKARYSQEGAKTKIGNRTFTSALNYIRVPLEFYYYFGQLEDDFRPKIFAGPSLAFLIGGKTDVAIGETTAEVDSKDLYEPFDFGLQAGAGFNYRLAEMTWLNFDVAYTHGFMNVLGQNSGSDAKNRLVNVNLGVAFGF